ncbi:MAG: calcium-binding protein [Pseudanabaena sp. CRU_2_10]|nr:calcium-binding protein [Pseudanabaena sp. CRU_2_10]
MAIVSGTGNDDVLLAGATGDTLIGRGGADALIAGVGTDILTGEAGYDQFIFQKPFTDIVDGSQVEIGGYGGNDVITDFQARAGVGDTIVLRNLDNDTGIGIRDDGNGNTIITIDNRFNIDPTAGASGTGNFVPSVIQTITVQGISANALVTQGLLEINGTPFNETTRGLTKTFGTYDYVVGAIAATFPLRAGGTAGNSVFGDPGFGQPGVAPENNLVAGDFVSPEKIASLLQQLANITAPGISIPGTDAEIDEELRPELEARKVIGTIPDTSLVNNAFSFAFDSGGNVDLSRFTRTFDPSSVNDDLIVGGPGEDLLIGGPGNDIIVGGPGTDIIWAGTGQDIIVGREGVDYIIFDSILEFRDRDVVEQDAISNALPDARTGYIRYEEPYGTDLTNPFTTKTGPDIIMVNSKAFNRGIDPTTNPELAAQIGYLQPGTIITGDGSGPAATKNGQLNVGIGTVPQSDGPAEDDLQPLFYYSPTAGRLFYDRDGTGAQFGDFWMTDMGTGGLSQLELPGAPSASPPILIYVY